MEKIGTPDFSDHLSLIKHFEGYKDTTYSCPAGVKTIGYGHTGKDVVDGMKITQKQGEQFLKEELKEHRGYVENTLKTYLSMRTKLVPQHRSATTLDLKFQSKRQTKGQCRVPSNSSLKEHTTITTGCSNQTVLGSVVIFEVPYAFRSQILQISYTAAAKRVKSVYIRQYFAGARKCQEKLPRSYPWPIIGFISSFTNSEEYP